MVSALASINEVNQRWARLVLKWATMSGFIVFFTELLFSYINVYVILHCDR